MPALHQSLGRFLLRVLEAHVGAPTHQQSHNLQDLLLWDLATSDHQMEGRVAVVGLTVDQFAGVLALVQEELADIQLVQLHGVVKWGFAALPILGWGEAKTNKQNVNDIDEIAGVVAQVQEELADIQLVHLHGVVKRGFATLPILV